MSNSIESITKYKGRQKIKVQGDKGIVQQSLPLESSAAWMRLSHWS